VGLLAREIEARGVTTAGLALVKEVAVAARAPRFLYLHWPFGHALGEPGNVTQQRTVLHDMLSMATRAPSPGLVVELPYRWRRESYTPVTDWARPSSAFATSLLRALDADGAATETVQDSHGS
jgi:D-proline reductase (dithiol) PrdB